jgi:hypothetical protein
MQAVGIVLLLISIGTMVVPVGAAVYICRDNLSSLVIPPEIQGLLDGNSSFLFADNATSDGGLSGLIIPTYVSSTVDMQTNTFSITVNVTNNLNYGLVLNAINATVLGQDGNEYAAIHLSAPVTIQGGQSELVTVSGQWTQAAQDYFNNHPDTTSANFTLTNIVFDVNSIVISNNQSTPLGEQINRTNLLDTGSGSGKGNNPIDDSED